MANDKDVEIIEMLKDAKTRNQGFRMLLKQYGTQLYWHIRRIVVSHEDAEDAMQETSIKIFNKLNSFKGDSSLITWIYSIATNEALQALRKRCNLMQSMDSESFGEKLSATLHSESALDGKAAEVIFQEALLKLPTQQRLAFNMRYYDDLPYDEIAKITGKQVNTLKTNYHFAVEKIKQYIKENAI